MTKRFLCLICLASWLGPPPSSEAVRSHQVVVKDDAQQTISAAIHANMTSCPCWNPFSHLKAADCCIRTDAGSLNWQKGERQTCEAKTVVDGQTLNADSACDDYCSFRCDTVPHKNDKQHMMEYIGEKLGEVKHFNAADILLQRASHQAQWLATGRGQTFIPVRSIHALHPVGGWREDTWAKTRKRKDAVLKAREIILEEGRKLTQSNIDSQDDLEPMRSITPFIAVEFDFCGYKHVLLEGNGRLKGMQLAEAEDETGVLEGMQVEVTLLQFPPDRLIIVQEGIALLWDAYAQESDGMKSDKNMERFHSNELKIKEYDTFRVGVLKCEGELQGSHAVDRLAESLIAARPRPCPVVDRHGTVRGRIEPGQLFGATAKLAPKSGPHVYQLCSNHALGVSSKYAGVVKEFCPTCIFKPKHQNYLLPAETKQQSTRHGQFIYPPAREVT